MYIQIHRKNHFSTCVLSNQFLLKKVVSNSGFLLEQDFLLFWKYAKHGYKQEAIFALLYL